jgi:transaldolase
MAAHAKPNACWLKSGQAVLRKPRWATLTAQGARPQRPLWASTSTKNPAYPDTVYVSSLIGPDTITTLPEATMAAFEDHGTLAATVTRDVDDAQATIERLAEVGVDLRQVAGVLEVEGVDAFARSYDELLALLRARAERRAWHERVEARPSRRGAARGADAAGAGRP